MMYSGTDTRRSRCRGGVTTPGHWQRGAWPLISALHWKWLTDRALVESESAAPISKFVFCRDRPGVAAITESEASVNPLRLLILL